MSVAYQKEKEKNKQTQSLITLDVFLIFSKNPEGAHVFDTKLATPKSMLN